MCYVLLLPCRHPPNLRCTIDRSVHCSRDPPCRLPFTASDHLPYCRQPRQLHYHHRLEQMNLRTTQFRKRGRSLSCLLTLYIGYYYLLLYRSILSFELPMGLISSQQRIVFVYYLVHLGSSMWFMLGGQQTIDDPLSIFLNSSYNLPTIISFGSIHSFATISIDFCMHPLGLTKSNYFLLLCMSDIVHNRTEHVEKKRRPLCANIMSCRRRSMVGEVPPSYISRLYSRGR